MSKDREDLILRTVDDLVANLLYYDRKEDEDLPREAIEEAVESGETTVDRILERFETGVRSHFRALGIEEAPEDPGTAPTPLAAGEEPRDPLLELITRVGALERQVYQLMGKSAAGEIAEQVGSEEFRKLQEAARRNLDFLERTRGISPGSGSLVSEEKIEVSVCYEHREEGESLLCPFYRFSLIRPYCHLSDTGLAFENPKMVPVPEDCLLRRAYRLVRLASGV